MSDMMSDVKYPKMSEASKKRWAGYSKRQRAEMRAKKSEAMKRWWASLTKEEQQAIVRKRAETMLETMAAKRAAKEN